MELNLKSIPGGVEEGDFGFQHCMNDSCNYLFHMKDEKGLRNEISLDDLLKEVRDSSNDKNKKVTLFQSQ